MATTFTEDIDEVLDDDDDLCNAPILELPGEIDYRVRFGEVGSALVYGYPAAGGFYELACRRVELDFLNLSRFQNMPKPPLDTEEAIREEEAHCRRMLHFGPTWWPCMSGTFMMGYIGLLTHVISTWAPNSRHY